MSVDAEKIFNEFEKQGYTDGLPIIPPTEERVKRMLEFTDRNPDDSLGRVPPSGDEATFQAIAVNAVMAGCKPEYFPVVVAEIEALLDIPNLRGAIATQGAVWPMAIVNGPISQEIGLYSSWGLFGTGPNHRANLTIGRTMTLVIQNIGKSVPGISEKKPIWNLMRYGICIRENEEESPWEPLHVEKGFEKNTSTVTVYDEVNPGGEAMMMAIRGGRLGGIFEIDMRKQAANMVKAYHNPPQGIRIDPSLYICSPELAKMFAKQGWNKQDIKQFYYENCKSDSTEWYSEYSGEVRENILRNVFVLVPDMSVGDMVPMFPSPESIWIVVAGGRGSSWSLSTHHGGHSIAMKPIALVDGTPAKSVYDFKQK